MHKISANSTGHRCHCHPLPSNQDSSDSDPAKANHDPMHVPMIHIPYEQFDSFPSATSLTNKSTNLRSPNCNTVISLPIQFNASSRKLRCTSPPRTNTQRYAKGLSMSVIALTKSTCDTSYFYRHSKTIQLTIAGPRTMP